MKNDINLLYKRKVKTYSNKNIATLLLIILLIGGVAFFAFKLPSDSLHAAKKEAAEIEKELKSSSVDKADLAKKTAQKAELDTKLAELNALKELKSDILNYIEVIESQRPSSIKLTSIGTETTINDNTTINTDKSKSVIYLGGTANSDEDIALFCLRLREKSVFKDVYFTESTTPHNSYITTFSITLTLPSPLESEIIIQELQQKDDITKKTAAAGGGK